MFFFVKYVKLHFVFIAHNKLWQSATLAHQSIKSPCFKRVTYVGQDFIARCIFCIRICGFQAKLLLAQITSAFIRVEFFTKDPIYYANLRCMVSLSLQNILSSAAVLAIRKVFPNYSVVASDIVDGFFAYESPLFIT